MRRAVYAYGCVGAMGGAEGEAIYTYVATKLMLEWGNTRLCCKDTKDDTDQLLSIDILKTTLHQMTYLKLKQKSVLPGEF